MLNWPIAAFIAGVALGAGVMYNEGEKELAKRDLLIAQAEKDVTDYVAKIQTERYQHALAMQKLQNKIGEIDVEHTQRIAEIQKENARLADCLKSGKCGLRLKGQQTTTAGTGTEDSGAGVGNGTACELTGESRRNYIALRTGLARQREQLLAAQKILLLCEGKNNDGERNAVNQ